MSHTAPPVAAAPSPTSRPADRRADVDAVVSWATGRRAPGLAGLLIWYLPLIVGPVTGAASATQPWPAWTALLLASACWFLAAASSTSVPVPRWTTPVALLVVEAVAVGGVLISSLAWTPLFVLVAIGVGATIRADWTPGLIVAVTLSAAGSAWLESGHWDATWTTALPTFLAGISTYFFCLLLSVVADLTRTREELAEVAVTEERLRFSRDLHDLLGHTLSVIVVKAEVVRRLAGSPSVDPAVVARHAADIEDIGRQALVEVRQAATSYRGRTLDDELRRAVIALEAAGVDLVVAPTEQPAGPPLPDSVDELFGWVVREAVTNVIRHSDARQVRVQVIHAGGSTGIEISDNGTRAATLRPGNGLHGLSERAEAAGGELSIDGTDHGLTLRVRAPLARPEPAVRR